MDYQLIVICVSFLIMAGSICMPVEKRFLVDCDNNINCSDYEDVTTEICGTDGQSYPGQCQLDLANQERFCKVGDFTQIGVLHNGNCTTDDE